MNKAGHQGGFSLLIALIILSLSLMVAMQAFRSGFYHTRMSVDHAGKTQAMLAAEAGALRAYTLLALAPQETLLKAGQRWEGDAMAGHVDGLDHHVVSLVEADGRNGETARGMTAEYWLNSVARETSPGGDLVTIKSTGRGIDNTMANMTLVARLAEQEKGVFDVLIQSRGNISLVGSGKIDSYDSTQGAYGGSNVKSGARVVIKGKKSVLTLDGGSPIDGDVTAEGNVVLNGSARVTGDINAGGNVDVTGGGSSVGGSIYSEGDVAFASSGRVKGSVRANGDITVRSYGARVDGDVQAGGTYHNVSGDSNVAGGTVTQEQGKTVAVNAAAPPDIALASAMSALDGLTGSGNMNVGPWRYNQVNITPTQVSYFDPQYDVQRWVTDSASTLNQDVSVLGTQSSVLNLKRLSVFSDGHLFIKGGDVVLYVNGNVDISDSARITIEKGATLTLLVTGRYSLGGAGAIETESERVIDDRGKPIFSIYSSYGKTSGQAGVAINGAASTYAVIYAPDTRVDVSGSGELYGALVAGELTVSGAGGVHYDEALKGAGAAINHGENAVTGWHIEQMRYSGDQK
ncbi:DUF7305 domain-containing protein [Kushneria indalinina]|uniref:Polymer-forming protein n=1 Tax=Kushneria indalinina DSM 14324 TaxID=1122140 RepID=A0A3D9DVZ8_9GAMM|nr:polymer-forming cytoskeletal protein [Kushneria indalinina]REC94927.1 polymer-forming protein [Kushneria indalinina DSM 14324]